MRPHCVRMRASALGDPVIAPPGVVRRHFQRHKCGEDRPFY